MSKQSAQTRLKPPLIVFTLLFFHTIACSAASANTHNVEKLSIVPAGSAPQYDLEKITNNAQDSQGFQAGVTIMKLSYILGMGTASGGDYQCSASAGLEGLCAVADLINGIATSVQVVGKVATSASVLEELDRLKKETGAKELGSDFSSSLDSILDSAYIQSVLAKSINDYVSKHLEIESSLKANEATHQLLVRIPRVQAEGNFVNSKVSIRIFGDAQLIDSASNQVLESYSLSVETPEHGLLDWEKGGTPLLGRAFADAISELGVVLAEESLAIVTSPGLKKKGYLVEALAPRNKVCLMGCKKKTVKNYGFYEVETLTPEFRWSDFLDAYNRDPLYAGVAPTSDDIEYELRIYDTTKLPSMADLYGPNEPVLEARHIKTASFTPEKPLAACTAYMWTVRTRFVANDLPHLTRWSGNYKERDLDKWRKKVGDPTRMDKANLIGGALVGKQDQQIFYRQSSYYFPFVTGSPAGKCD